MDVGTQVGEQEDGGELGGKPDLYTTMCKIDSWWEAAVSAGSSAWCSEMT